MEKKPFHIHIQISKNATTCSRNLIEKMSSSSLFTCKLKIATVNIGNSDINNHHQSIKGKLLQMFKATPIFDKTVGLYACEIQLLTSINEIIGIVNNAELNLELNVSLFI